MHIVVSQVRNQTYIDKAFKGVLEEKIEENACDHDTNHVSYTQFKHFIELDVQTIRQLAVNKLNR